MRRVKRLAEAAFRALKSELSIRPIFHQLERRVKAHVLVAFLGYALWVTLKHLLVRKNPTISPAKALSMLSGLRSADIVLPTTDRREIRLRLDFDYECSADSEVG
jgi:transposase